jgi:protein-S-isoprenylcysteine O-methyltransferase Ste14
MSLDTAGTLPDPVARFLSACGAVALHLTLAGWALLELGVRVRERLQGRGGAARDRATRLLIAAALGVAIAVAVVTASPRTGGWYRVAGLLAMWLGLAIRIWAIATLGRAFRTTVEVDSGQDVISSGPYRWVRHPSYSGLLLIVTGCGLASGSWVALIVSAVLPLVALLRRIRVEEAELVGVLGDRYRAYQRGTKRLIPGVW